MTTYKVGDILEHDRDFDRSGPLGIYFDYPIVVDAVHEDGTVDLLFDPSVLPVRIERTDPALMGLRPRVGKEEFDRAMQERRR